MDKGSARRAEDGAPISRISRGNKSKQLRVYFPQEISEEFGIGAGDHIKWYIDHEAGTKIVKIRRTKLITKDY